MVGTRRERVSVPAGGQGREKSLQVHRMMPLDFSLPRVWLQIRRRRRRRQGPKRATKKKKRKVIRVLAMKPSRGGIGRGSQRGPVPSTRTRGNGCASRLLPVERRKRAETRDPFRLLLGPAYGGLCDRKGKAQGTPSGSCRGASTDTVGGGRNEGRKGHPGTNALGTRATDEPFKHARGNMVAVRRQLTSIATLKSLSLCF